MLMATPQRWPPSRWLLGQLSVYFNSLPLLVLLVSLLLNPGVLQHVNANRFGLTAYGEPCTDQCSQRGFPYAWCHKKASHNGTWVDRDYCSPGPGLTRYLEPCLTTCHQTRRGPFYWCQTAPTLRGDWDYCSPFPKDACSWGPWGPWSQCTLTCGPSTSTRTRRRRLEMADGSGRVGDCSGAIEQSIALCKQLPDCQGKPSSLTVSPRFCFTLHAISIEY